MQEMERFRNPVTAFSYRFNGQTKEEYIVGPVRAGVYFDLDLDQFLTILFTQLTFFRSQSI